MTQLSCFATPDQSQHLFIFSSNLTLKKKKNQNMVQQVCFSVESHSRCSFVRREEKAKIVMVEVGSQQSRAPKPNVCLMAWQQYLCQPSRVRSSSLSGTARHSIFSSVSLPLSMKVRVTVAQCSTSQCRHGHTRQRKVEQIEKANSKCVQRLILDLGMP